MPGSRLHLYLFAAFVLVVAVASYFLNGPQFSVSYSSDQAVHVLMANDFRWPQDLYYWRQNRLGSIVPMVGYALHSIGLSTVTATGLAKYAFLLLGLLAGSSFLRSWWLRGVLALAWFYHLPNFHNWTALGHPYAECTALALSGFALTQHFFARKAWYSAAGAALCWMLALWVSELTIALLPALLLQLGWHWKAEASKQSQSLMAHLLSRLQTKVAVWVLLAIVAGGWLVLHAKAHARSIDAYSALFASPAQIAEMLERLAGDGWEVLAFQRNNALLSITAWLMMAHVVALPKLFQWINTPKQPAPWIWLLAAGALFGAVVVASWSNAFGPGLHYYTAVFPFAWLAGLCWIEQLETKQLQRVFAISTSTTALVMVVAGYVHQGQYWSDESPYAMATEVQQLGKTNIVANYWDAYVLASAAPDSITATARQGHTVRREAQAFELVRQPEVYLVRDLWMDSYPDSVRQFGALLVKDGEEFELANCNFCRYRYVPGADEEWVFYD